MLDLLSRENDTIAAIATPSGRGGIGIIRVSGPLCPELFAAVFRPSGTLEYAESHRLYHGWARDPAAGSDIDEVLAVLMRAPRSYTREDVLEIQCHSGPAILRRILEVVLNRGARIAEPGEFTKRAFLNGRMDLTQAEAVLDLTTARTEAQRQCALNQLDGRLSGRLAPLRESILDAMARLEVGIDFPEDDVEIIKPDELASSLRQQCLNPLDDLLSACLYRRIYREGARVVITGRPNVGKSRLFNALLGEDRVIVSSVPGTTRDVIEESLNLSGLYVSLADTAGIRDLSEDIIEIEGVHLARRRLANADLLLLVLDGSETLQDEDRRFIESLPGGKPVVIAVNKKDIWSGESNSPAAPPAVAALTDFLASAGRPEPLWSAHQEWEGVSACTGEGLSELRRKMRQALLSDLQGGELLSMPAFIPNLRQETALRQTRAALEQAVRDLEQKLPAELAAIDLSAALAGLDEILGINASDDVLDRLFSRFCIGK